MQADRPADGAASPHEMLARLDALLGDEDLTDEKLRAASVNLLPAVADALRDAPAAIPNGHPDCGMCEGQAGPETAHCPSCQPTRGPWHYGLDAETGCYSLWHREPETGEPYTVTEIAHGLTYPDAALILSVRSSLRAVERERDQARQAIVTMAIPLEVLAADEQANGEHRDISPSLRACVHAGIAAARRALSPGAATTAHQKPT